MSRRDATSRSLRRRRSRTVPASLVAVVLLAVGALATGRWAPQVTGPASTVGSLVWGSTPVLVAGGVLLVVGIVLLLAGLTPGAPTTAWLATTETAANIEQIDFVISARALARLAVARADTVDGVEKVSASANGRRVHLRVTTSSEHADQVATRVREGVADTLAAAGVLPAPRITAAVRTKEL